jgi:transcriptional regulator with XRE-family HTH domain
LSDEVETVSRLQTGTRPASLARLEQLSELFSRPVIRFFQHDNEDVRHALLQTLADALVTRSQEEQALLVRFVTDAARLFKERP